jgi:hypothetical protein
MIHKGRSCICLCSTYSNALMGYSTHNRCHVAVRWLYIFTIHLAGLHFPTYMHDILPAHYHHDANTSYLRTNYV